MRRFLLSFVLCLALFIYLIPTFSATSFLVLATIRPSDAVWQFAKDFGKYEVPGPPPVVYVVFGAELSAYYCPDEKEDCAIDGLYEDGVVLISLEAALHRQEVTIVHELMHFLQDHAGKVASSCEHEREAYAANNAYAVTVLGATETETFPAKFYACPD